MAAKGKPKSPSKPKPKSGRPTALTKDLQERLVAFVRAGNTFEIAARACGISRATFYRWKQEGRAQGKGAKHELLGALEEAEALCEAESVLRIAKAAKEDWKADAWRLERRHPERWGRHRSEREAPHRHGEGQPLGAELITDKETRESHRELLRNSARAREGKPRGAGERS